eukprot:TRINITY_DN68121_c3_g2_i1.p1 TRINITY_DN68121_c3_g2~~TRINITY_DN68121_c3_g2_i1.p1  ORF type:complete len:524 (-),score=73.25 TRINITY_DN68121_c3_g2_i1:176-1747(-)
MVRFVALLLCLVALSNAEHYLIAAGPWNGHLKPVVALAEEMVSRGHRITLGVTQGSYMDRIRERNDCYTDLLEIPLNWTKEYETDVFKRIAQYSSQSDGAFKVMQTVSKDIACLGWVDVYKTVANWLVTEKPDAAVIDFALPAAAEAVYDSDTPLVTAWSMAAIAPNIQVPDSLFPVAPSATRNPVTRLMYFIFKILLWEIHLTDYFGDQPALRKQTETTVPQYAGMTWTTQRVVTLLQYYPGFDYPNYLPSNFFVTGPLLSTSEMAPNAHLQLPADLSTWLDTQEQQIALISLGTTGFFLRAQMLELFAALEHFNNKLVFLWRMSKEQHDEISSDVVPPNIKFVAWFTPSQFAVMSHPKISFFITHAGMNGPQEAICAGLPMVAVPAMADQMANAVRVQHSGAGPAVMHPFTTAAVVDALDDMLQNFTHYKAKVRKLRAIQQSFGGVKRAADIVELVGSLGGSDMFVPDVVTWPVWAKYNLDLIGLVLCLVGVWALACWLLYRCCCWCCCKRGKAPRKQHHD